MEHSFRIAIWMFLLLGFLQARPTTVGLPLDMPPLEVLINDFGLELLKEVSCRENVTFASPSTMTGDCPSHSLMVMKDGLDWAKSECKDTFGRVDEALGAWNLIKNHYPMETSSNCTSQEAGNWTQFLRGCETLFERLGTKQSAL